MKKWPEKIRECITHEGRYFEKENEMKWRMKKKLMKMNSLLLIKSIGVILSCFIQMRIARQLFNRLGSSVALSKEERTKILAAK